MSNSNPVANQKIIQMEGLWWVLTVITAVAVILPVYFIVGMFPFLISNIIFVVAFITLSRYIFLLPYTFLAKRQVLKQVLIFICFPIIFFLIQELNSFQTFLDENGMKAILGTLPLRKEQSLGAYLHAEMLLFAVGAIIAAILLPFRLGLSIWRTRNRGSV
ncbi:MAG: hypothetical protein HRU40_03825 [Saprospiraceae bacterium]|nr:hypothetical protein [Saprospiraceae bacterium]